MTYEDDCCCCLCDGKDKDVVDCGALFQVVVPDVCCGAKARLL